MNTPNDFLSRALPVEPMQQSQPTAQQNDFLSRALPVEQTKEEPVGMTAVRNVGANLARAGEAIGGAYGNIRTGVENLWLGGIKKFGPEGLGEALEAAREEPLYKQTVGLPNTEVLREGTKKLTGNYLEPRNEVEKAAQETTGDIASLVNPYAPGGQKLLKAAGLGIVGQVAKQTSMGLGADEGTADNIKTGTMVLGSFLNPKSYKNHVKSTYKAADELLPKNSELGTKIIQRQANLIKRQLSTGEQLPWKKNVLDTIESIESKMSNGKMKVSELQQHIRDIYDKIGDWETPKKSAPFLKKLAHESNRTIKQYGKSNPEWYSRWSEAQALQSAMHQSKKAGKFISNVVKQYPKLSGLTALYGVTNPAYAASAVGTYGALKSYELLNRVLTNKTAAKYYFNALQNSLKENQGAVIKNLAGLDKELSKESSG